MNEVIRTIRYEDIYQLMELYKYLHEEDPIIEIDSEFEKHWKSIYEDEALIYIVLEVEGKIVSTCNITIIKNLTRGLRPYGLIENVMTHPDYRGKGYGTKVLQKAIEEAKNKNCYKVMLMTGSKKKETLDFYEKAGFDRQKKTAFIYSID